MRSNILNTALRHNGISVVRANGWQMVGQVLPQALRRRLMQRLQGILAFHHERSRGLKAKDCRNDISGNRFNGLPYACGTMPGTGIDPTSGTRWITG